MLATDFAKRYSLYRSGWHRFWFAMFCCGVLGITIAMALPTPEEREVSSANYMELQRQSCERSCSPKSGYLSSESLNPLYRPPNDIGYRRKG